MTALPHFLITPLIRRALREDLGRAGDITTEALIAEDHLTEAKFVTRRDGCIAGLALAEEAFRQLDPTVRFQKLVKDGTVVQAGQEIASVQGKTRAILTAERVALNFLSHLSGIATLTNQMVQEAGECPAKICCTRKTTPGLRMVEKYAVRAGGGVNHRFGLDDGVLIKDNHITAVGSLTEAITRARAKIGLMVKIEVEVDTLEQMREALQAKPDAILLDNMSPEMLKDAVQFIGDKAITEASGNVSLKTVRQIAESGVQYISIGALTHSAPILDIGLDF